MTTLAERLDTYIDAVNAGERPDHHDTDPEFAELSRTVLQLRSLNDPEWPAATFPGDLARQLSSRLAVSNNGHATLSADAAGAGPLTRNPWVGDELQDVAEAIPAPPSRLRQVTRITGALTAFTLFALVLVLVFRDMPGGDSSPGIVPPAEPQTWEILFAANSEHPDPGLTGPPNIYLTNSAGTTLRTLATGAFPAWSPDGSQVAYSGLGGSGALYVMNADGSEQRPLTDSDLEVITPAWSPDGEHIAFLRSSPAENRDTFGLWVVNADGSGERPLVEETEGLFYPITWSPDGTQIAYASSSSPREHHVHVVTVATDETRTLVESSATQHFWLEWSPDGTRVASMSERADGSGTSQINLIDAGDGEIEALSATVASQAFPTWSPDGRFIAFAGEQDGIQSIYTMEVDNLDAEPLLVYGEENTSLSWPSWSPDSRHIGFVRNRRVTLETGEIQSTFEVAVIDVDGSNLRLLAGDIPLMALSPPAWRPTPSSTPVEEPPGEPWPTVTPDPDQAVELQEPDGSETGSTPPVVWLSDGMRQAEGSFGSYGWLDHDAITYARVTAPFIDIQGVDGLEVAPGAEMIVSLQDGVPAPSAITASIYTWAENNAIPASPEDTSATYPSFVPTVPPVEQTALAIDDPRFSVPSALDHYVVELTIQWPDDERLPDGDDFRIWATYAVNVYVIDEPMAATPIIIDPPVTLTPTIAPDEDESQLLTIEDAVEIVRRYLDDPEAQLTGTYDTQHADEVWLIHEFESGARPGEYRVDRETGIIVEGTNPQTLYPSAPEQPITDADAIQISAEFLRQRVGNLRGLERVDNQPHGIAPGPDEGDPVYTAVWIQRDADSGQRLPSVVTVSVNLRTGLVYGWVIRIADDELEISTSVSVDQAVDVAVAHAEQETGTSRPRPTSIELQEHFLEDGDHLLVWSITLELATDPSDFPMMVKVDATTGAVLDPGQ